jgi:hypothetical protein
VGAVVGEESIEGPASPEHGDDKENENVGGRKSVISDVYMDQRSQHTEGRNLGREEISIEIPIREEKKAYERHEFYNTPAGEKDFENHCE